MIHTCNVYCLGEYIYKNFNVYKKVLWIFRKKVTKKPLNYEQGIIEVHRLNGIERTTPDYSHLTPLNSERLTNGLEGKFLVNFKDPEFPLSNDPMEAEVKPYKGRLFVKWINGSTAVIDVSYLNIWELE